MLLPLLINLSRWCWDCLGRYFGAGWPCPPTQKLNASAWQGKHSMHPQSSHYPKGCLPALCLLACMISTGRPNLSSFSCTTDLPVECSALTSFSVMLSALHLSDTTHFRLCQCCQVPYTAGVSPLHYCQLAAVVCRALTHSNCKLRCSSVPTTMTERRIIVP